MSMMSLKRYILGVLLFFTPLLSLEKETDLSILADIATLQKNAVNKYNLSELIKASDYNYSLQAKALSALQAKKNLTIQKWTFLPQLNVDYSFQSYARDTPQNSHYNTQVADAKFMWNLFNGFATINGIKEKRATYLASLSDEEYTRQSIYLQVVQEYYGYFDNVSKLISLQKKLDQIKSDIARVQKLYNQGLSTIDDLESLKAQSAQSEYQIEDAKLAVEQNRLMLEYLTNLRVDGLRYQRVSPPEFALIDNESINAAQYQIDAQIYQNKQLHYYPTIDLSNTFTYNIQKPAFAMGALGNIYPSMQNTIGITVTWKLLDNVGIALQKQSYKVAQLASEKNLYYKKMEQKKDEELYRKTLEIAKRKIESAKASLRSANIAYANIKKKYDAKIVNFTDYLQALSTKFDAESTLNQSLDNYELQKANYIFYSGQKIKDYLKESK